MEVLVESLKMGSKSVPRPGLLLCNQKTLDCRMGC